MTMLIINFHFFLSKNKAMNNKELSSILTMRIKMNKISHIKRHLSAKYKNKY